VARTPPAIAAWCELRTDFRHFRIERIRTCKVLDERVPERGERLISRWMAARGRTP
jgi:predicted DNA-binding transcriptional regulator YafY